jgi:uncharacterized protein (TIGR00251 family)
VSANRRARQVVDDSPMGAIIEVRVIPRARKTEWAGARDGALLIRLAATPVDGAANDALVAFFAARLHVAARTVRIVGGDRGRHKRLLIVGLSADEVRTRLGLD